MHDNIRPGEMKVMPKGKEVVHDNIGPGEMKVMPNKNFI